MKKYTHWIPAVVWMGIIFYFSSRSRMQVSHTESVNFIVFKSLHIIEYAILYILNFRAMKYASGSVRHQSPYAEAFMLTVLFSATDEIHQTFIPTRGGMARDVIIDSIGSVLAWIHIRLFLHRAPVKLRTLVLQRQLL